MVSKLFHFLSSLLPASILILALLSATSTAHIHLVRSSPAFHPQPAPSSLHRIQQTVSGLDAEDLIGAQGEPISVRIKLPSPSMDAERKSGMTRFLMFRGLPAALRLSAGFQLKSSWAVSAGDLPNLKLLSLPDYQGAFLIEVTAHSADGGILARATIPLIITPIDGETIQAVSLVETGREEAVAAAAEIAAGQSQAEQDRLFRQGEELMDNGLVAGARLLFHQLADRGNARAAYAMAQSFDGHVLDKMNVVGLMPDAAEARAWYGKAAELGYGPAKDQLAALEHFQEEPVLAKAGTEPVFTPKMRQDKQLEPRSDSIGTEGKSLIRRR